MSATLQLWVVLLALALGAGPAPSPVRASAAQDDTGVAAVVSAFHEALAAGDVAAAESLLAPDAVILESGELETREQYLREHLPADIAFAQAVRSERSAVEVARSGTVAWAVSTSESTGELRGRRIHSRGAELMVLARGEAGWRIRAIHWSAHSRPTEP